MKNRSHPGFPGLRCALSFSLPFLMLLAAALSLTAAPAVVLNEVHYHPVEKPAFNADGTPFLDLSDDVHEFVEIYNAGATNVPLAGWHLSGDVDYDFPPAAVIVAGRYLVIAKDPARLLAIPQYALNATNVLGPFQKHLGNHSGTVRLRDLAGGTIDSVSYSSAFPWAIGADALGADDEWTGLVSSNFQYRGRSLERVSATWPANDPANWLASPATGNPSPARANAVTRTVPKPVVLAQDATQDTNGATIIRSNQPVRIDCTFSATNVLSSVSVEYFLDDINVTNESRLTVSMSVTGAASAGRYTALLPGRPDRTLVRYRIRANRGSGLEPVSPRADDPFAWHAYFVTPARTSTNRIYDCFISAASLNTLATNLNPAVPSSVDLAVLAADQLAEPARQSEPYWNATEPAVFVVDGEVYDARARYHGSQYRRDPAHNSWKWQFPRYKPFEDREGVFISDNDDITVVCGALYRLAGVPQSYTKWISFYLNANASVTRMDQDEMDTSLVKRFFAEQRLASPELPEEGAGEFYKSQGNFLFSDPTGPFGYGGYRILPARPPYWTELQRYENTFGLQMNGWKGHVPFLQALHDLWAARGDSPSAVNPNLGALRAWLAANFDVDTTLASIAVRVWCGGWDNFNHNSFAWRRANGKWAMLQWDFDQELGGWQPNYNQTSSSIFASEYGVPPIYSPFASGWVDANWINDSFFKAYREEYKRKLWLLNNTLLNPTNMVALGFGSYSNYAAARFASINTQVGLGVYQHPLQPTNIAPANSQAALAPQTLQSSPYLHTALPADAHRSTTWFIRAANGTYAAPVFKTTSTSNLTSLPIPFSKLDLGASYYWKCLHTDTNDHPSLESAESKFIYGAEASYTPVIALDADTIWRYSASGVAPAATWKTNGFDDSLWLQGAALFGTNAGPLPEPIRTPLALGIRVTYYFRKTFTFSGDPASTFLRLRHIIDDGAVFYLNGVEIHRIGMSQPPGSNVFNSTLAGRSVSDPVYEGPFAIFPTNLLAGANVLAVEVHRSSQISSNVAFGLVLEAAGPPMPGSVVLNEILADNRAAVTNAGGHPDFIELFNTTAVTQNLNGLSLSDNTAQPGKYIFPPGAVIPPLSHFVVWCDNDTNSPGLHTGFALDNDGQTVALFTVTANGFALSDSIPFGLQIPDRSIGRVPDGSGAWGLTQPTPELDAIPLSPGSPAGLKINEWMASDEGGPDWLELYNSTSLPVALGGLFLTDDLAAPAASRIAPLSFIAPGGFRQFIADQNPGQGARHVDFKLSGGGEAIGLFDGYGAAIDSVTFGPQLTGVSQGRLPDGTDNIVFFATTASPEEPNYLPLDNVVINEVLSHSDPPLEDAVELLNPTGAPVDISGWWLSDDKFAPRKFQFPPGSIVPAGGYLAVDESQFNPSPGAPGSFAFSSAHGDSVYLSVADGAGQLTGVREGAKFDPAENGVSFGRFETSQGTVFTALAARTFGAANAGARVGPVVISEIMYHPLELPGGIDNARDEFIELRNITAGPVPLFDPAVPANRWRLRDAVDFTFPAATTLLPGETVLVVGFDPVGDTNALAGFLDTHRPISARLFGPWLGKLDNSGESVELVKPDAPVSEPGPDFGFVPTILVDRVKYADSFPWPVSADGTGLSLMRSVPGAYGNDPTNWFAWVPTPGVANSHVYTRPPVVALASPTNGAFYVNGGPVPLAAYASGPDAPVASVEYFIDGTGMGVGLSLPFVTNWTSTVGPHQLAAVATDATGNRSTSAPVHIFVQAVAYVDTIIVPSNSVWKYLDTGTDQGSGWTNLNFGDGAWASGAAQLGFGDGDETTVIARTNSTGATNITFYFRQKFTLASLSDISGATLRVMRDDGVLVWLNGVEVFRNNLPNGPVNFLTLASTAVSGADESAFYPSSVAASRLVAGQNILAVEMHQNTNTSSDISFAAELRVTRQVVGPAIVSPPASRIASPGDTVTFSVTAVGGAPLGYQWFYSGSPLPGETGAQLTLTEVELSQAGAYSVTVSNVAGFVTGAAALAVGDSDADFDGLPDAWEIAHGLDPLSPDAGFDVDGDGMNNYAEFIAGTDPTNALSYLRIDSLAFGRAVVLSFAADADLAYTVEKTDALGNEPWTPLAELPPAATVQTRRIADAGVVGSRFYRLTTVETPVAPLRIDSYAVGPAVVLTFNAVSNRVYSVEYTDTLGSGPWTELQKVPGQPSTRPMTVADPATTRTRVYRLVIPEP